MSTQSNAIQATMASTKMSGTISATFQTTPMVSSQLANTSQATTMVSAGSTLSGQGTQWGSTNPFGSTQSNTRSQFAYFTTPHGAFNSQIHNQTMSSTILVYTTTSPYVSNRYTSSIPLTQIEVLAQQV